jgi:hypothetical protein
MIPKIFTQEIRLEDGRTITLETGKLAKQADGSVVVKRWSSLYFLKSKDINRYRAIVKELGLRK